MTKLNSLLKVYLQNSLGLNRFTKEPDPKKRRKNIFIGFGMAILFIYMLGISFLYSYMMAGGLASIGQAGLILPLMMAATSMITLVTCIFKVQGILFGFRDFDTMFSLPIKSSTIVASRLLILYLMNVFFSLLVLLPAGVVYAIKGAPGILFYPYFLISLLCVPLVPIIVGSIIGGLIALISSFFQKAKNVVNLLISVGFFAAVMVFSMSLGSMQVSEDELLSFGALAVKMINRLYPLAGTYYRAVGGEELLSLLLFVAISLAAFALFSFVVGHWFGNINTMLTTSRVRSNYKLRGLKVSSPFVALYRKEIRRFFGFPMYVLNTAIGAIMLLILSLALCFFSPDALEQALNMPGFASMIGGILPSVLALMVSLSSTTLCTISLEGKNLWILRSLPVEEGAIFNSKLAVNYTVLAPAVLISGALLWFKFRFGLFEGLMLFLLPLSYMFLVANLGLVINLLLPKFDWTAEITAVKQSAASFVGVLVHMVLGFLPLGLSLLLGDTVSPSIISLAVSIIVLLAALGCHLFIMHKGKQIFRGYAV